MLVTKGTVWRSGATQKSWNMEPAKLNYHTSNNGLSFTATIASKGGGKTDIKFDVPFEAIEGMLEDLLSKVVGERTYARELLLASLRECLRK